MDQQRDTTTGSPDAEGGGERTEDESPGPAAGDRADVSGSSRPTSSDDATAVESPRRTDEGDGAAGGGAAGAGSGATSGGQAASETTVVARPGAGETTVVPRPSADGATTVTARPSPSASAGASPWSTAGAVTGAAASGAPAAPERAPWDRPSTGPQPHGLTRPATGPQQATGPHPSTGPFAAGPPPGAGPRSWGGPSGPAGPGGPGGPPPQGGGPWGPPPGSPWSPPAAGGPPGTPSSDGAGAPAARRRKALIIAAVALVVVVVLVVGTIVLVDGVLTRRSVAAASQEVGGWSGVTYRGPIEDGLLGPAAVEVTVDGQGNAAGTITRAAGGRAEFLVTRTEQAIRADEAYWAVAAPRPRLSTKLTGQWLRGANEQLAAVSGWALSPAELSRALAERPWSAEDGRSVGGVDADVVADGPDRVAIDAGERPRPVEVELASFGRRSAPVSTERAEPAALQNVAAVTAQAASMPVLGAAIASPPLVYARVDPVPQCGTPICPVTVRVFNVGLYRTTGTLTVLQNEAPAATFPVDVAPGAVPVVTAQLPNQAFATGVAQVTTRIAARLSDLE